MTSNRRPPQFIPMQCRASLRQSHLVTQGQIRILTVELVPHPASRFPKVTERDYGMKDCKLELNLRAAVAGYVLQQWNVDCSIDHHLEPVRYRLWLKDADKGLYQVEGACPSVPAIEIFMTPNQVTPLGTRELASTGLMLRLNAKILRQAKTTGIELSIFELLDYHNALIIRITNKIPQWVIDQLNNDGLCIERAENEKWFIESLGQ